MRTGRYFIDHRYLIIGTKILHFSMDQPEQVVNLTNSPVNM
jgi:hypothetical protein